MRQYDDLIDVRRGLVGGDDAPEQFVWRGRLWVVRQIVGHWIRTGAWWERAGSTSTGSTSTGSTSTGSTSTGSTDAESMDAGSMNAALTDLLAEREVWRVEAGRGATTSAGVFDLAFDWSDGHWRLVCSID